MSRLYYLGLEDLRSLVETLTADVVPGTPAFQLAGSRGTELVESALAQPLWAHYRTAQHKAAALHFSLNKNHAYVDGNKRLAVTAMEWFLLQNDFFLHASNGELVSMALAVADNSMTREESERWIAARAVRRTWSDRRRRRWLKVLSTEEAKSVTNSILRGDADEFLT